MARRRPWRCRTAVDLPFAAAPDRIDPLPDRWSASGWLVARAGRGSAPRREEANWAAARPGAPGLSAVAARTHRRLRPADGAARRQGREAAIGLEWQPTRAALRLVAEQRFGLDGTPGGTGWG
jgi:hypothetical protein